MNNKSDHNQALQVLHIEDSEEDSLLIARFLRRASIQTDMHRVENAAELYQALQNKHWDVVLSDNSMPGFSGLEALKLVHQYQSDTPFIFVSGTLQQDDAINAVRSGARDFMSKNNMERLPETIRREIELAEMRRSQKQCQLHYRNILDTAPDAIVTFDDQGKIIYLNHEAEKLFGYSAKDAEILSIEAILPAARSLIEKFLRGERDDFLQQIIENEMAFTQSGEALCIESRISIQARQDAFRFTAIVRQSDSSETNSESAEADAAIH